VRITLTLDREGDGTRELAAEIDAGGNVRMINTSTGAESDIPAELYVGFDALQHEILVIDGHAYRQDGEESAWLPAPGLEDYLERSLRGSEGPGLWMRLLAADRETRGTQAAGAYQAEQFHLAGLVDEAEVSGDIWLDAASGALVRADLEVPGHLYAYSGGGAHYPVVISMKVEPAEIEPVTLQ
jgi:hypothetical protein